MELMPLPASERELLLHINAPGIRNSAERDRGYSPLVYSGLQGAFSASLTSFRAKKSDYLTIDYATGTLSNSYARTMQGRMASIRTYTFYHRNRDRHAGLHWGWSNNNEFNTRNFEDARNFNDRNEYFTSFGPAVRYLLPFSLFNRQFHFETLSNLQLLGFKLQSSYITSLPRGFEEPSNSGISGFMESIELFYPGNSLNFLLHSTLRYELNSGNMLSLSYRYDYLWLNGAHITEKSRGSWYFGIITLL